MDFRLLPLNFNLQGDRILIFLPGKFAMEGFFLLAFYNWTVFILNLDLIAKSLKSYIGLGLMAFGVGNGRRETSGLITVLI